MNLTKNKRVLLKISGEWLANKEKNHIIDYNAVDSIAIQLKELVNSGVQIAIVVGGGNIWRGASAEKNGISRTRADYIGMLATLMNALALQSILEKRDIKTRVQSSVNIDGRIAENFITEKANAYLNQGEIVIFAAGTGRPYFTTDTAAVLVATEIKADIMLIGKNNTDGVYDSDPNKNEDAKFFTEISYNEILKRNLAVMDSTAIIMARDNKLKSLVFNIGEKESILKVMKEKGVFTKINE